jgi:hypothetical protein
MLATGNAAQDAVSSRLLIILAMIALAAYWRSVLKIVLTILAIAVIVLVGAGAFELLNVTHG